MEYKELKAIYHALNIEDGLPGFPQLISRMRELTKLTRPAASRLLRVPHPTIRNHESGSRKALSAVNGLCYMMGLGSPGKEALRKNILAMLSLEDIRFPDVVIGGSRIPDDYHIWSGNYTHTIRALRKMCQLSRPKFAELVGMSPSSLKNYELGYREVSMTAMAKFAIATSDVLPQAVDRIFTLMAIDNYFKNV